MMTTAGSAIEVNALSVAFDRWGQRVTAVDRLDLSVREGEWVVLVGHNGSGKSTLLRALSGRVLPTSGSVVVMGHDPSTANGARTANLVFYVHQDPRAGSAPDLTVFENLWVADPQSATASRRKCRERYLELLRPIGLDARLDQLVQTLSGGERQLLTLLVASLRPASIILLDEPFSALDPRNARTGLDQVEAMHRAGKTILQVTHDEKLAMSLGTRTVVLRSGRVVYDRPTTEREPLEIMRHWHDLDAGDLQMVRAPR